MDVLRAILDHLPTGVLLADDACRYTDVNRAACALLGREPAELIGRHVSDLVAPGRAAEVDVQWRAFLRDGMQSGVFTVALPDGTPRTVHFVARAHVAPGVHVSFLGEAGAATPRAPSQPAPEGLLHLCAWTKRVKHDGEWVPLELYFERAHGLRVSHGISPEALAAFARDAEGPGA
ncbi:MAG: PAS domain-containing protein [Gemmatimonadales bacterium]|nr:PAS domain-containing protein [Gemmatimonadales bacterium]